MLRKNRRYDFHEKLVDILGSRNVYFQPPESIKLNFPCIVYNRVGDASLRADDIRYKFRTQYSVTVIDKDPDSEIPEKLAEFPYTRFDRHFTSDNLNHDVYTIYY